MALDDVLDRLADQLVAMQADLGAVTDRLGDLGRRADARDDRHRADAEAARERRERGEAVRVVADSAACRDLQARADGVLQQFGERAPQPVAGEAPDGYRVRLLRLAQAKLPPDNPLAKTRLGGIADPVGFGTIEQLILDAAAQEATAPSWSNLPADGSLIQREVVDPASGLREVRFFGRSTFIKHMTADPQYVRAWNLPADQRWRQ